MFDPTAFDNMKVVIEGAIYDLDISGEIMITDRNDLFNMAKMSRQFDICFMLPNSIENPVLAKIMLESKLVNLAAELLPSFLPEKLGGSHVCLEIFFEDAGKIKDFQAIEAMLLDIWGATRKIKHVIQYNPLQTDKQIQYIITVEFDRLINEEQMDDLVEMTDFMITTLRKLQIFTSNQ